MPDDLAEEMVRALSELRTQNAALDTRNYLSLTVLEICWPPRLSTSVNVKRL